ncbi:hypothetical protein XELAEV_18005557mg [Xenopus laevis]|uniref:Uncharacterized protein n=1 Tax=Xenopus laevis TaxID=8355 RepID=A0A974DYV1_XENLA|nr:hypothetical protein XELAEV_18005557mg [Xenopus laevis]
MRYIFHKWIRSRLNNINATQPLHCPNSVFTKSTILGPSRTDRLFFFFCNYGADVNVCKWLSVSIFLH